ERPAGLHPRRGRRPPGRPGPHLGRQAGGGAPALRRVPPSGTRTPRATGARTARLHPRAVQRRGRRPRRPHRRDQARVPVRRADPRPLRAGGAGRGLLCRRRHLLVRAHGRPPFQRLVRAPARGAGGLHAADAAQGLHRPSLASLRVALHGGGLRSPDHGGVVRPAGRGTGGRGPLARHGRVGGGPRRTGVGPGARPGNPPDRHKQPQSQDLADRHRHDRGTGAVDPGGPHPRRGKRHPLPRGRPPDGGGGRPLHPRRRTPAAAVGRRRGRAGAGGRTL
ncbi:MAG: Indole-3-glycerol phosphate synthase, partial [uncultured Acetobacteraceae bacterium]